MIEAITRNFVNPAGLLALLGIIPLLISYLVKPKPEEEVMPSMAFFSEDQKKGKIQNALQALKRNRLLLLHILFISLAALAIANPLVSGLESDGKTVILLDTSASMHDNRQQVENFALKHLGNRNTIITVSGSPEIELRDASTERARSFIQGHENSASSTDLVSALQLASNFGGKVVIASDMDHTGGGDLDSVLNELAADRTVKVMDIDHRNSHGFTDLRVENGRAEVTIRNFIDRNRTIELQKPGENRKVVIPPLSSETVSIDLSGGAKELSLPMDEFSLDNKLYVSMPENRNIKVAYLGEESRYFRTAIELINSTSYIHQENIGEADVYFIGKEFKLTEERRTKLKQKLKAGAKIILENREDLPEFAPVENASGSYTTQVRVSAGMATSFNSSVTGYDVTGTSLAEPEEALVLSQDEDVLLYNVDDGSFGQKLNYPIFWKQVIGRMTDLKTGSELNLETGTQHTFGNSVTYRGRKIRGYTTVPGTGFYRGKPTYAANLLNPEESSPNINTATSRTDVGDSPGRDPARKYIAALLALIGALEMTYLSRRGELR